MRLLTFQSVCSMKEVLLCVGVGVKRESTFFFAVRVGGCGDGGEKKSESETAGETTKKWHGEQRKGRVGHVKQGRRKPKCRL